MTERRLSEDDVTAIANALEHRLASKFYNDLGKGIWGLAWKAIVLLVLTLAAYGAGKGIVR
jgi:hypothetical protein